MAGPARSKFDANIRSLLPTVDYTDLTVTCRSDTYKVHRAIVCSRVEFFKRSMSVSMKVQSNIHHLRLPPGTENLQEGKIDLPADDPTQIRLLMQYLYEPEYEPKLPASHTAHFGIEKMLLQPKDKVSLGGTSHLHYEFPNTCSQGCLGANQHVCQHHLCGVMTCNGACKDVVCTLGGDLKKGESKQFILHSQMYALAEKYQVDGLKELALEKFKWCCVVFWYTSDFLPAARHVFDDTTPENDRGLRDLITFMIVKHMEVLSKPDVWALIEENNDLSSHVLKLNASRLGFTAPEPQHL